MAAAVMRAMSFGTSSSSSSSAANSASSPASSRGRDGNPRSPSRSRSRSSSKQRPGGKGALDDGDDEGGAALSRTSSVLLSSAPEVQPQSILLNPSTTRSPPLSPAQAAVSSSLTGRVDDDLDLDDLQSPTPRPGYARSTSTSSVGSYNGVPVTPMSAGFPTGAALLAARNAVPSAHTSPNRPPNLQRASKIRFAPLPEIRPRAYSTGRNVWIVEEDDPSASSGRRQRLVRVNGEYDDDDEDFTGDSDFARFDDDSALGTSPSNSLMKWGSWTEALGLTPSTSRRSADEDALSLTSSVSPSSESGLSAAFGSPGSGGSSKKILKALGLGGKTAKTKRTGKEDDDHLTRTSSTESHGSHGRRASVSEGTAPPRPPGSTGIPMQRSSTWEIGDMPEPKGPEIAGERGAGPVYYASPARTSRRRAQYPPVAQGRNRRSRPRGNVAVEEPAFEEWGAVGVGSNAKKRSVVGSAPSDRGFDEDDDGTGMAWLRRRRLQREQEERERALQEVALAEASTQAESAQAPAPLQLSDPNEVPAETTNAEENQDTLTRDPTQRGPADEDRRMPLPFLIRTPPSRSGTVDSTVSTASTIRPSSPVTSIKPSGLSATRPVLAVDTHAETASDIEPQEELAPLSPGEIGDEEDEVAIESESDSSEAESEDDDLDEEELAREEALAEEARRMAKSMGAERYHSARHENQLKVVDA